MFNIPKIKISREGNVSKEDIKEVAEKAAALAKEKASNLGSRISNAFKGFTKPLPVTD